MCICLFSSRVAPLADVRMRPSPILVVLLSCLDNILPKEGRFWWPPCETDAIGEAMGDSLRHHGVYNDIDDLHEWLDNFIFKITHRVVSDQEAAHASLAQENVASLLYKREMQEEVPLGPPWDSFRSKLDGLQEASRSFHEAPLPKFLRVAERMRRWKQQEGRKAKKMKQMRLTETWAQTAKARGVFRDLKNCN